MTENRRLAAIMAIDVAGYSRLMGEDEAGTVRDHRRGGARFFLRSQCDVLDSGTVATLHQQHARLFGRHRPSRSRTRQALKEHRVSFRANATCGRIDVNEVNRLRGAEIRCIKVRSPAQRRRPERPPSRSASRRFATFDCLGRVFRAGSSRGVRSFFQERSVLAQPTRSASDRFLAYCSFRRGHQRRPARSVIDSVHSGGAICGADSHRPLRSWGLRQNRRPPRRKRGRPM